MPIDNSNPSAPGNAVGTPSVPWRHVFPGLCEVGSPPSTTITDYANQEYASLPASDLSTGIGVIPVRSLNQVKLRFFSSDANNTTVSVPILGLRALETLESSAFQPAQEIGGAWLVEAIAKPQCIVGDQTVNRYTAGLQANGDPVVARWIDDGSITSLDYSSNPPGMQMLPASGIEAGVARTFQFDVTGVEHLMLILPAGWNALYSGI